MFLICNCCQAGIIYQNDILHAGIWYARVIFFMLTSIKCTSVSSILTASYDCAGWERLLFNLYLMILYLIY